MSHFSAASNSSAGAFPPDALSGVGLGSALASKPPNDAVESPRAEQTQWFTRDVLPHEPALRAWLFRNHASLREELDDVVQETYFRLLGARAAGPIRCARTYLFGIARHVALGLHRKQRNLSFTSVHELPDADAIVWDADVAAIVNQRQELAFTAEAIKRLPDRCREIVVLHTVEGLSYREIAQRLGLAEETVRVQIARAVKKCIALLRERSATKGGAR